jgi:transcriptional regulator with XRE-family HTH domain
MDFLDKLEFLMKEKNITNLNELSTQSNIPYTTLKGFYTRGTDKIQKSTLKKLADFFNCTLDYLVCDDVVEPSKHFAPGQEYKEVYKIKRALKEAGFLDKNEELSDENLSKITDFIVANKKFIMGKKEDK